VLPLCSLCEVKEGAKKIYIHLSSFFTGIKTNMLLIIFLGVIATLTSVSRGCDFGNLEQNNFDWYNVRITVLTQFLKYTAFKTAAWFYISFVVPLTNCQ
jgi:hypothetical protein